MTLRELIIEKYPEDHNQQIEHLTAAVKYALENYYAMPERTPSQAVFINASKGGKTLLGKAFIRDIDPDRTLARIYDDLAKAILLGDDYMGDDRDENERFAHLVQKFIENE